MIRLLSVLGVVAALLSACAIQEEIQAGADYGAGRDMDACLSESLARLDACDSTRCELLVPGFARACAATAEYSESLCSGMSGTRVEAAARIHERCKTRANPKPCYEVHQQAVKRCGSLAA